MAEAIGLATSIVGLIDATTKILYYVNTIQDAQKDANQFASEASSNLSLLFRLKQRLDNPKTSLEWQSVVGQSVGDILMQVEAGLVELVTELQLDSTGLKKFRRKLLWPIFKADFKDMLDRIQRLNTLVGLALDDNLTELTSAVKSDTTAIKKDTALIKGMKDEMGEIASHTEAAVDSARQQAQERRHQKVVSFIASHDFGSKLSDILSNRQSGTGDWFVQAPEFREWLQTDGGILWCPGIPGAGKTTLIATAIDHLQSHFRSEDDIKVLYAFCDYKDQEIQTVRTVLASLWGHLMKSRLLDMRECEALEKKYLERKVQPPETEMLAILQDEIARYPRIFILLDALDEFSSNHREDLLFALQKLGLNVNILITSRYIAHVESTTTRNTQQLQISAADADLRAYIAGRLTRETRLGRHVEKDPKLAEDITNIIIQRAQGMFLLAQLHLSTLSMKLNPKAVRKALNALPEGRAAMKETYDQALLRIETQDPDDRDLAERVITWLCYSLRPLTLADLQYAVSFDPDDDDFGQDDLIPVDLILSVCGGLVILDSSGLAVRFVHYTTQEYFKHFQAVRFPNGHADMANVCIRYLCLERFAVDTENFVYIYCWRLDREPLLKYASLHWGNHVRHFFAQGDKKGVLQPRNDELNIISLREKIEAAINILASSYSNLSCALSIILQMTLPGQNGRIRIRDDVIPKSTTARTFNAYAYFGLDDLIKTLASTDTSSLRSSLDNFGNVLHWAALGGHESTLELLLQDYKLAQLMTEEGCSAYNPFEFACEWNQTKAAKSLLNFGAKPTHQTLWSAAEWGNTEMILAILATTGGKLLIIPKDGHWQCALGISVARGDIEETKLLLAAVDDLDGADIAYLKWCRNRFAHNPVNLAAPRLQDPACYRALLESSTGVQLANARDYNGQVPFQRAIQRDDVQVVKLFLDWTREDLFRDCPDVLRSALHLAVAVCAHKVVSLLLDRHIPGIGFTNQHGHAIVYNSSVARCDPRDERVEALADFLRELYERYPIEELKRGGDVKWGYIEAYNFLADNGGDVLNMTWKGRSLSDTKHRRFAVFSTSVTGPTNETEIRPAFLMIKAKILSEAWVQRVWMEDQAGN